MRKPTDSDLVQLYRDYSEDIWCAGWMSDAANFESQFTDWLVARLLSSADNAGFTDYEQSALPVLRRAWAEALQRTQDIEHRAAEYAKWADAEGISFSFAEDAEDSTGGTTEALNVD